jgi:hypothetical protein
MQRRRFKRILSFPDRPEPEEEVRRLKDKARTMRAGKEREMLLKQARHLETAARLKEWLNSPGLQSPK